MTQKELKGELKWDQGLVTPGSAYPSYDQRQQAFGDRPSHIPPPGFSEQRQFGYTNPPPAGTHSTYVTQADPSLPLTGPVTSASGWPYEAPPILPGTNEGFGVFTLGTAGPTTGYQPESEGKKLPGGKSQDVRGEGKVIVDENAVEDMSAVNKR